MLNSFIRSSFHLIHRYQKILLKSLLAILSIHFPLFSTFFSLSLSLSSKSTLRSILEYYNFVRKDQIRWKEIANDVHRVKDRVTIHDLRRRLVASNHSSSNYYVSTRVGRPLNIRGARLETLVLASENGAETVSVIHQDPSASRKINISCANERWPSLGAKERSVKNGGRRGGKGEKWGKNRGRGKKCEK